MPSTRSGLIYNNASNVSSIRSRPIVSEQETPIRKSPRLESDTRRYSGRIHRGSEIRPEFLEPTVYARPRRSNRTAFSQELIQEFCDEKDNDSTSDYEVDDEEVQQYTRDSFLPVTLPRYEVEIDFDDASTAWRSNKRRVGESWVYTRPRFAQKKHINHFVVDGIAKELFFEESNVATSIASRVATSIASRVKETRRGATAHQ